MESGEIISVLEKWNFWNRDIDTGIRRDHTDAIKPTLDLDKVITLTGVRRCGKSYIARQLAKILIERKIPPENILIVNFEEPYFEGADLNDLVKIYESYREIIKPSGKPYLILDEIQEVSKWEKFVRSINEKKEANIIITGSSSKLMSEELATTLTGRQLTYRIFPLSFKEFLRFKGLEIADEKSAYLNTENIKKFLWEYAESGGFPETALIEDKDIQNRIVFEYYNTIINRDIISRFRIRGVDKIKSLAKYYISNISSPITYRKLSPVLDTPVETLSRFSEYLQTSNIVFFLDRFSFSLKEQQNSPRKVYAIDNSFFTAIGFRFMENRGKLIENLAAVELRRRCEASPSLSYFYWKDQQQREVDFVIKEGNKIKQVIQVCYSLDDLQTKEREIKGLKRAAKVLNCKNMSIITWDEEGSIDTEEGKIKIIPLWKWLFF
jgi:hypothetical protein